VPNVAGATVGAQHAAASYSRMRKLPKLVVFPALLVDLSGVEAELVDERSRSPHLLR
jgi:hypothetical protein